MSSKFLVWKMVMFSLAAIKKDGGSWKFLFEVLHSSKSSSNFLWIFISIGWAPSEKKGGHFQEVLWQGNKTIIKVYVSTPEIASRFWIFFRQKLSTELHIFNQDGLQNLYVNLHQTRTTWNFFTAVAAILKMTGDT